jgi:IS5 family transposase
MKISYQHMKGKPRLFKSFFGVTVAEFDELYTKVVPVWSTKEHERLNRRQRQRAIGGGRDYDLSLRDRLLMTLMWLKLYLNTDVLGFLFEVDGSTVSRNVRNLLPTMRALGEATLGWVTPPERGQTHNMAHARAAHPDLFAIVDATEQPVRRASDNATQREAYSGKKKRHTRKTQIVTNEHGVIRDVSASSPGSQHDLEHFRQAGTGRHIPPDIGVLGDAGYQGLDKELPDHSVGTAHKARRNHPLTQAEKDINREFSSTRIVVENTLCELKHFKVLAHCFRHALDHYDDAFRAVVAIVNPRIKARLAQAMGT